MNRSLVRALLCSAAAICTVVAWAAPPEPAPPPRGVPEYQLPPFRVEELYHPAQLQSETQDWAIADLNIPEAWQATRGKGAVVAVLDTGVYDRHQDLDGQILFKKDFTRSPTGWRDVNGHGTWCLGAPLAADNGKGMVGAAPEAKGWVGKVLGDSGSGSVTDIAQAVREAADWVGPNGERVDVISMSLGGGGSDPYLPPAIAHARAKGCIIVAAAGNSGPGEGTVGYPGGYPHVICVAAHNRQGQTSRFSSRGPAVFVSAPGEQTRGLWPGRSSTPEGEYATISGTSMATPYVAAVALLWCASHPEIPRDETRGEKFRAALQAACRDMNQPGRDTLSGWGRPDAAKLVAGRPQPTPPDTPPKPMPGPSRIRIDRAELQTLPGWKRALSLLAGDIESVEFTLPEKKSP